MTTRRRSKNRKSHRNTRRRSRSRCSQQTGGGKSRKRKPRKFSKAKAGKAKASKADPYGLQGKKVCHNDNYVFDDVYAFSNYYVYRICLSGISKNCEKILAKVYKYKPKGWHTKNDITTEARYMKLASKLGVSPAYISYNWCNYDGYKYAIILMEKYGEGNLTNLYGTSKYKNNKVKIDKAIKEILDVLYDENINQNDIHSDNFLYHYNTDTEEYEFKIIDFDKAQPLDDSSRKYKIEILTKPRQKLDLSYITKQ